MAKKIVLIVVGAILLLCGLGVIIPGALLMAVAGRDDAIQSDFYPVSTPTAALVSEVAELSDASNVPEAGIGRATITISARSDRPIFLGVGPSSDVDRYLAGIEHDELTEIRFSPYRVDTIRRDGRLDVEPPGQQAFWVVSDSGTAPSVEWRVEDGNYRVVLMNEDGTPAVSADASAGIQISGLFGVGVGMLITGIIAALIGLGLLILGILIKSGPKPATAGGPAAQYGPPPSVPPPPPGAGGPPGSAAPPSAGGPPPGSPPPGSPRPGSPPPGSSLPGASPPGYSPPPPGYSPPPPGYSPPPPGYSPPPERPPGAPPPSGPAAE